MPGALQRIAQLVPTRASVELRVLVELTARREKQAHLTQAGERNRMRQIEGESSPSTKLASAVFAEARDHFWGYMQKFGKPSVEIADETSIPAEF